ncbi:MAG TPA: SRPBCC domain-containing protein [Acidimicrobiales bacterium]|nr:SRPBCC domain-containing protein [Acidimicrobiales bacterium]
MTTPSAASSPIGVGPADYRYAMQLEVPVARIIGAVTDEIEIQAWWTSVSATERHGDQLRLAMGDQSLVFTVAHNPEDDVVTWSVTTCEMAPDWVGTKPTFSIRPDQDGNSELEFRHVGLVPSLECYDMCRAGWGHFMPSLRQYLETGQGLPNQPRLVSA